MKCSPSAKETEGRWEPRKDRARRRAVGKPMATTLALQHEKLVAKREDLDAESDRTA